MYMILSTARRCATFKQDHFMLDVVRLFCTKAKKVVQKKSTGTTKSYAGKALSKFNWENDCLYGPLLQPATKSKKATKTVSKLEILESVTDFDNLVDSKKNVDESELWLKLESLPISDGKPPSFPFILVENSKKHDESELRVLAAKIFQGCAHSNLKSPSVTSILQKTMSAESAAVLERWRNEMISKLGVDGFAKYQRETFDTGSAVHKMIFDYLTGKSESDIVLDEIQGYWKSVSPVLPHISNVISLEKRFTHPYLNYVGVIDCVASYKGTPMIIEWKTSQKPKATLSRTYDNPVQLAAYLGGWNFHQESTDQITKGLIVVAYSNGNPAHVHPMDHRICQSSWNLWLSRLNEYWQFKKAKLIEYSV